jgi:hypothetical protein
MAVPERFADLVRLPVSDLDPYPSRNGRVGRFHNGNQPSSSTSTSNERRRLTATRMPDQHWLRPHERAYPRTVENSGELARLAAHPRPFYEQLHVQRLDVTLRE